MKFGLQDQTIEDINRIFVKYPQVERAILYGSRAKGNYKNGSDVDLTLKGEGLNLSVVNKISNEIDDLLTPYSFDISIFKQISNSDLIEHIQRAGLIFYEKIK